MRRSLFTAEYDTDRTSDVLGITACIPNEQLVVAGGHAVYNSAAASSTGGDEVLLAVLGSQPELDVQAGAP